MKKKRKDTFWLSLQKRLHNAAMTEFVLNSFAEPDFMQRVFCKHTSKDLEKAVMRAEG